MSDVINSPHQFEPEFVTAVDFLPNELGVPQNELQDLEEVFGANSAEIPGTAVALGQQVVAQTNEKPNGRLDECHPDPFSGLELEPLIAVLDGLDRREKLEPAAKYSEDGLTYYLNAAGRHPLLSSDDEVALSKLVRAGQTAKSYLDSSAAMTDTQREEIHRLIELGSRAKSRLWQSNLRLVVSFAKQKHLREGLPLLDLIQEGNAELSRCIEKFDWQRGFAFSTLAANWLFQCFDRANFKSGGGSMQSTERQRTHAALRRLEADGLTDDQIIGTRVGEHTLTPEDLEQLRAERLSVAKPTVSLDAPAKGSYAEVSTLGELIADPAVDAEDEAINNLVLAILDRLPKAIREIIEDEAGFALLEQHFGLHGESPLPLSKCGERMAEQGYPRQDGKPLSEYQAQRVKQKIIDILRHPSSYSSLRQFFPDELPEEQWKNRAVCDYLEPTEIVDISGKKLVHSALRKKFEGQISMCNTCPVRIKCLNYAKENKVKMGIWGGEVIVAQSKAKKSQTSEQAAASKTAA